MTGHLQTIAFLEMPGGGEWLIIMFIGLLVFGRRLPDVARSLGKSINEFKKGMREFQDSADEAVSNVNKATSEAMSEADVHASQTLYETTSEPGVSQMTNESAPQAEADQVAGQSTSETPTSETKYLSGPTEHDPSQSTPADSCHADSQQANPQPAGTQPAESKPADSAGSHEPMA
jgi:sec-independent protein translocase protein TatA